MLDIIISREIYSFEISVRQKDNHRLCSTKIPPRFRSRVALIIVPRIIISRPSTRGLSARMVNDEKMEPEDAWNESVRPVLEF